MATATTAQQTQHDVLCLDTSTNPLFTNNVNPNLTKSLKTSSKVIVRAINELKLKTDSLDASMTGFTQALNGIIGDFANNTTLLNDFHKVDQTLMNACISLSKALYGEGISKISLQTTATNVVSAINEIKGRVDTGDQALSTLSTDLNNKIDNLTQALSQQSTDLDKKIADGDTKIKEDLTQVINQQKTDLGKAILDGDSVLDSKINALDQVVKGLSFHNHTNLDTVLERLTATDTELSFNNKALLMKEVYQTEIDKINTAIEELKKGGGLPTDLDAILKNYAKLDALTALSDDLQKYIELYYQQEQALIAMQTSINAIKSHLGI